MASTGKASRVNGCTCGQRKQRNSTHSSSNYSILSPVMITVSHSLSFHLSLTVPFPISSTDIGYFLDISSEISKQWCSKDTCKCVFKMSLKCHIYQNPVSLFSTLINSFPSCLLSSSLTCSRSKDEGGKPKHGEDLPFVQSWCMKRLEAYVRSEVPQWRSSRQPNATSRKSEEEKDEFRWIT